jgi:hypothetical protein
MEKPNVTISTDFPPNYEAIRDAFPDCVNAAVFAYGRTVHNPFGLKLTPDLLEHEEVHLDRQQGDPEAWWKCYIGDMEFRLQEEIESYGRQYLYLRRRYSNKATKYFLYAMGHALSGPLYGCLLSQCEAESKIRNKAKELLQANG